MERFLKHLPHLLDEEKLKQAYAGMGDAEVGVQNVGDGKSFVCNFQLQGFKPEDIKVKTQGQKVIVDAKTESNHEDEEHESYSCKQYQPSIVLPENVNTDQLTSYFTDKGMLKLPAPSFALPETKPKIVPVVVVKMETA